MSRHRNNRKIRQPSGDRRSIAKHLVGNILSTVRQGSKIQSMLDRHRWR